jgi:hypothetical protein
MMPRTWVHPAGQEVPALPARLSPRRQFQILFGLCLGVFPAVVLGFTLIQRPPEAAESTTPTGVVADLGMLVIVGALAAAALLFWTQHAWLHARLAAVVVIAALLGAGVLLTATLTTAGSQVWRFPLVYLVVGLGFTLAGLISTIAAAGERERARWPPH